MRSYTFGIVTCGVLALAACGDDGTQATDGGGLDGATNPDLTTAMPAPYGLDARPTNTTCVAPARPPNPSSLQLENSFPNLAFSAPTFAVQAPGDATHGYVTEQGGAIKRFDNAATAMAATTVVTIPSVKIGGSGEGGLLSMAFSPSWATDHRVYISATFAGGGSNNMHSEVFRLTSPDNGATFDYATKTLVLQVDQPADNHNGGNIAFGPDGNLYIGFGDGGGGGDPFNSGRDLNTFLSKMLRVDVTNLPYAIPPTNPFATATDKKKEIYAYGFRNPWRWSFDKDAGDLWVGDVGQDVWEEIDHVTLGGDYGWSVREGKHCYPPGSMCDAAGLIDPVVEYMHTDGNKSVVGGYVYHGMLNMSLQGTYVYTDTYGGKIWGLFYDPITGDAAPEVLVDEAHTVSSFAQGNDGELYIIDIGDGRIRKLIPKGATQPDTFPKKLSLTGCVDPADPKKPAAGLIPYIVNSPLWSDNAEKERFIALPEGKQVAINDDGDLDLPVGTVAVKTFLLGGKRIETRLLVRHDDGDWAGYTYEWDNAETDATLLTGGKSRMVGTQQWDYPSRAQCLSCHTTQAGRSLGLELAQLNRDAVYPSTNRVSPQLATWEHIGLFSEALPASPGKLPDPKNGTEAVGLRAASYLHSNCSMCHRPMGPGRGPADFRYGLDASWTKVCNVDPTEGNLDVTGAKLLTPGQPSKSIISLRMHSTTATRMPQLGTNIVDDAGTAVIDSWITGLTSCP